MSCYEVNNKLTITGIRLVGSYLLVSGFPLVIGFKHPLYLYAPSSTREGAGKHYKQ